MVNFPASGMRPVLGDSEACAGCQECLSVCPAIETKIPRSAQTLPEAGRAAGPILELWEAHAADPGVRHAGASGGALTALAAFCLEQEAMHGVLHIGQDPDDPLRNRTVLSRSRAELLAHTGSRYAPASACDSLQKIEEAPAPCVFIGQPSEVAAVQKARKIRPALDRNLGLTLSFFCAGSPSSQGTVDLLRSKGIDPSGVETIRYRGRGWPGAFAVWLKQNPDPVLEMTYAESWHFLQSYRPWAVHLWPDGTGEHADIACGDPWYRKMDSGDPGSSLIIVRTERGRQILRAAQEAGYLRLTAAEPWMLLRSQDNLVRKKGEVWGRLAAMRLLGLPTPAHHGYGMFRLWLRLSWREKLRSTFGTVRRIWGRKLFRPDRIQRIAPPGGVDDPQLRSRTPFQGAAAVQRQDA
jgi:coenzyme F420 hydrogenase subunit beta